MKTRNRFLILKIMAIISAAMLMMLLCGCRTRLTNNTEVTQTISDESGIMTESYQQRRDELGIPVAESPLFTGAESDEEDYEDYDEEYDEEFEEEEEYDEEEEDDLTDDEDEDDDTTQHSPVYRRPGTTVRRPSTVVTRPQVKTDAGYTVTLDVNGKDAKCSKGTITVKKGSAYGALPEPTRKGYDFKGWYTSKEGGNKVSSKTKVKKDKAHTLYAHWKEVVIEKKKFTVTFDGNSEEDDVTLSGTDITVEEDGTYGELPKATREKYTFIGWFTDPDKDKGSQVTSETRISENADHTLYAHWDSDPYAWWNGEYVKALNEIDEDSQTGGIIEDDNKEKASEFLEKCRSGETEDEAETPAFIIKFIKQYDEEKAAEEAEALREKYSETAPDARIIIVSNDALYGSKEVKLLYKIKFVNSIYGSGGYDLDEAEYDLLEGKPAGWYEN